jgi:hypothetical protein
MLAVLPLPVDLVTIVSDYLPCKLIPFPTH